LALGAFVLDGVARYQGLSVMRIMVLASLVGVLAGLRSMMPLAAVSWAAATSRLNLSRSWLAFLGYRVTPFVLSIIAIAELVVDQLPSTPSRKVPIQFGARVFTGAAAAAILGIPRAHWIAALVAGAIGAIIGTYAGAMARGLLAVRLGDRAAAVVEDVFAILLAALVVFSL
jgi:uncharacterized membrane protein